MTKSEREILHLIAQDIEQAKAFLSCGKVAEGRKHVLSANNKLVEMLSTGKNKKE